ncbi:hypothetical protein MMPV_007238 [Pyropia vietnamensis]
MSSFMNGPAGFPLRSQRGRTVALAIATAGVLCVGFALVFPASLTSVPAIRWSAGADPLVKGTVAAGGAAHSSTERAAFDISNTYVFEACLGWSGICVEPNTRYLRDLHTYRTCEVVPLCLADQPKTVTFIDYLGLSGIADTNKNINASGPWQRPVRTAPRRQIDCTTAAAVLRRSGLTRIDFLSLDVEGAELAVLQGIDWNATRIDVIALEEENDDAGALAFLVARGYQPVYFNPARKEDILCFHPDVKVGVPTP